MQKLCFILKNSEQEDGEEKVLGLNCVIFFFEILELNVERNRAAHFGGLGFLFKAAIVCSFFPR